MLASLVSPVQALVRWIDDHPHTRLFWAVLLIGLAVLVPMPAWALDVWVMWSLATALGMAALLLVVGGELSTAEAMAGLPAYLHRFAFHRVALSIALTKAILTEQSAGMILDWIAHHALARNVGAGLAVVFALYMARLALAPLTAGEKLQAAAQRLASERERLSRAIATGSLSPQFAARLEASQVADFQAMLEIGQIGRLLRFHTYAGLALAAGLVGAGLLAGMAHGWPWFVTLTNFTVYAAAEGVITAAPGVLIGLAMSQWLREPRAGVATEDEDELEAEQPALVAVEVGREALTSVKRAFPALVAMTRTRVGQALGVPLPRVALLSQPELPPFGVRLLLRGQVVHRFDMADREPTECLAAELEAFCRVHAAGWLTMEHTQQLLAQSAVPHPLVVAQALERLGLPSIHGVFQGLIREQIPLRDPASLLEALLVAAPQGGPTAHLIDQARLVQASALCERLIDDQGSLYAVELGSAWEEALANAHVWDAGGRSLAPELIRAWRDARSKLPVLGTRLVVLAPRRFRAQAAEWLRHAHPEVVVLAPEEISPRFQLRLIGSLRRPVTAPVN